MKPTEILVNEHRVIEQGLDCLEKIADRCEREGQLDAASARDALTFLRGFADRCHHGKEENQLFALMEQRGFSPHAGPVAVMLSEHVQGRALIQGMDGAIEQAGAGEAEACKSYVRNARAYIVLLRQHIQKEDHCLFPMADRALNEDDQRALWRSFEKVEHEEIGDDVHSGYLRLVDELADRYGVRKDRVPAGATSTS